MCITALALEAHPCYPFILVHTRDEDWDRATEPVQTHDDGNGNGALVFARDVQAGGTFLGLNLRTLGFGASTNIRSNVPAPTIHPAAASSSSAPSEAKRSKAVRILPTASTTVQSSRQRLSWIVACPRMMGGSTRASRWPRARSTPTPTNPMHTSPTRIPPSLRGLRRGVSVIRSR